MLRVHLGMQIIALQHPLFSSPPNQLEPVKNLGNAVLLWIFGLAKARARKGYHNPEREWRGSAGWLAFVPAVHFRGRGGGLQRCERFQDLVAVARAFRHDPRVARFQVHDLAFDM